MTDSQGKPTPGNSSSSSGIGVCGLLGVAFVVLKLLRIINWSWWWVTIPFWGGFALAIGILLFGALGIGTFALIQAQKERKRLAGRKP